MIFLPNNNFSRARVPRRTLFPASAISPNEKFGYHPCARNQQTKQRIVCWSVNELPQGTLYALKMTNPMAPNDISNSVPMYVRGPASALSTYGRIISLLLISQTSAGGKPSTWFPPGRLVEHMLFQKSKHAAPFWKRDASINFLSENNW